MATNRQAAYAVGAKFVTKVELLPAVIETFFDWLEDQTSAADAQIALGVAAELSDAYVPLDKVLAAADAVLDLMGDDEGDAGDSAIPVMALNDLSDVTITAAATGEVLKFNGTVWADGSDATRSTAGPGRLLRGRGSRARGDTVSTALQSPTRAGAGPGFEPLLLHSDVERS